MIFISSFFTISVLPVAHALTARTDFNDRHTSASSGYSTICGDHICAPGEHYKGHDKVSQSQHKGLGKIRINSGIIWHNICGGVRC